MPVKSFVENMYSRMWRAVNSRVAGFYQYIHLIFGANVDPQLQASDQVALTAKIIFKLLKERRKTKSTDVSIKELWDDARMNLENCTELEALLIVVDEAGFNVLQTAIKNEDTEVLELLLCEGIDLNSGRCSFPLHLACKIGNLAIVEALMEGGANQNIERGMCYPNDHVPVRHVPSRFHFLEADIFACDGNLKSPLMYAIQLDHVDIVKCLLRYQEDNTPVTKYPLHYACKCGAYECMKFLVQAKPVHINKSDQDGLKPLHHAVKWGKSFVQFLIESGANIHAITKKNQTSLHLLYKDLQSPEYIYTTTKFLLGAGLEQDAYKTDSKGNTALHVIVSLINRLVASFPVQGEGSGISQKEFDQQVLDTIRLLLQHNCEADIFNCSGVTAMHKMSLMSDFEVTNDPSGVILDTLPVKEHYKVDFNLLSRAMAILFHFGAKPDCITNAGRTCLMISLQSLLNMEVGQLLHNKKDILGCMHVICKSGAKPSGTLPSHKTIVSILAKFGQRCVSQRIEVQQIHMSVFLKELMTLLLEYGLHSNHCSLVRKLGSEGGSGNILVEIVRLTKHVHKQTDLNPIHDWVLTLLQHGANPDIEPYPSESIICHSQSSIFLKPKSTQPVNHYMYEIQDVRQILEGGHAEKLLMLFYNSMDHHALYRCLSTARFMSRFDPEGRIPCGNFLKLIASLSSQPRSLQQIARVAIYKSINRNLSQKVQHLPLPKPLQEYLLQIE